MSGRGMDWYKRDPQRYLGGVIGMTVREHAVYGVVIDLLYVHGGSIPNDPKWISGWFADMGISAVRNTIESLVTRGKLTLDGDKITQKRAKNEVETQEKHRENARKTGKKGGEKSAKTRAEAKENSDLGEAGPSIQNEAEKSREEKKEREANASQKKKRKTPIPEDAVISPRQIEIAAEEGHGLDEAEAQFSRFKSSALANDRRYANWDAAWRNWFKSDFFNPITTAQRGNAHVGSSNSRQSSNRPQNRSDPALEQIARLTGLGEAPGNGGC